MFKSGDPLAETSWITTSISFRVFAEDHRTMEASFRCHWQHTHISVHAAQHLLHWLPKDCVIHLVVLVMNNFVWPYFVLSYIFKVHSIPGRIRNFLNNYPFLHKKRNFVFNRLSPLTWSGHIHGAFAKKAALPYGFVFLKRKKIGAKVGLWSVIFRAISPHCWKQCHAV